MLNLSFVQETLKKHIADSHVVVAVSGGPDSMFLLYVCQKTLKREQIVVAHFDHQIRKYSYKDAQLVEDYCSKNRLIFVQGTKDIQALLKKKKGSLEEVARTERYAFLRKIKSQCQAKYILVAHHRDDNVETMLLHFFRGSGLHGLTGLQELNADILRPLLGCSKKEILAYCKKNKVPFAVDKTNLQANTSRNMIRLKIIPLIKKINPGFDETLLQNSLQFRDIEDFLKKEARQFLNQEKD